MMVGRDQERRDDEGKRLVQYVLPYFLIARLQIDDILQNQGQVQGIRIC